MCTGKISNASLKLGNVAHFLCFLRGNQPPLPRNYCMAENKKAAFTVKTALFNAVY